MKFCFLAMESEHVVKFCSIKTHVWTFAKVLQWEVCNASIDYLISLSSVFWQIFNSWNECYAWRVFSLFSFNCSFHMAIEAWTMPFRIWIQLNPFVFVIRISFQRNTYIIQYKISIPCGTFMTRKRSIINQNHEILIESLGPIYFDFKNIYAFVWYYLEDWPNWIFHEFWFV
jgi:hypothetical protein